MDNSGDNTVRLRPLRWRRHPEWLERARQMIAKQYTGDEIATRLSAETGLQFSRSMVLGKLWRAKLTLPRKAASDANGGYKPRKRLARPQMNKTLIYPALVRKSAPEPSQAVCEPVSFIDLKPHHCRWIVKDAVPAFSDRRYCGAKRAHDSTQYCEEHYRISRQGKGGTL